MRRKLLATLLALAMVFTLVTPVTVMADTNYASGADDEAKTFGISTKADLDTFRDGFTTYRSYRVSLNADIDLGGASYTQSLLSGAKATFTGTFYGNGHKLSNFAVTGADQMGFVPELSGRIENLKIDNATFTSTSYWVGAVVGRLIQGGVVDGVTVTNTTVSGTQQVGGVVGKIGANSTANTNTIQNCTFSGSVSATASEGAVGGILGQNQTAVRIENCAAAGTVSATSGARAGGIMGFASGADATITNCTNTGNVTGGGSQQTGVGGILGGALNGTARITDCRSTGGISGPVGRAGGIIGALTTPTNSNTTVAYVEYCTVNGTIGNADTYCNGGIVGQVNASTTINISASAMVGTFSGKGNSGAVVGNAAGTENLTANKYTGSVKGTGTIDSNTALGNASFAGQTIDISNANRLLTIAQISKSCTFYNATLRLTDDIDMSAIADFPMIGSSDKPFVAAFSGQGYTIRNLDITSAAEFAGLFVYLGADSITAKTVGNFTMENCHISGTDHVGAVAGLAWYNAVIDNVTVAADCTVEGTGNHVGGIAGRVARDGQITNCTVAGSVVGSVRVGGIAGSADLAASSAGVKIIDCAVPGAVTGVGAVGGVIGSVRVNADPVVTVSGCSVSGTVTGTNTADFKQLGGIIGLCNASTVTVEDCWVSATLQGTESKPSRQGGIIGGINNGTITVNDCLFSGTMDTAGNGGGVVGAIENGTPTVTINRCLCTGELHGSNKGIAVGNKGVGTLNIDGAYGCNARTTNIVGNGEADEEENTAALTLAQLSGVKARINAAGLFSGEGDDHWTSVVGETPVLANFSNATEITVAHYDDISAYRGATYTAPAAPAGTGTVFAGWFTDEALTTPLGEEVTSGKAYAKFVDANVLSVKIQQEKADTKTAGTSKVRIVTTVDGMDYTAVGFKLEYTATNNHTGANAIEQERTTVYSSLLGYVDENTKEYTPTYFSGEAYRFFAFKLVAPDTMAGTINDNGGITATPYWITQDGTKVYGTAKTGIEFADYGA